MRRIVTTFQSALCVAMFLAMCGCNEVTYVNKFAGANDFHVTFAGNLAAGCSGTASGFGAGTVSGNSVNFSTTGTIGTGGSTTIKLSGCGDIANQVLSEEWTLNGTHLGFASGILPPSSLQYADAGSGNINVSFVNAGTPFQYDSFAGYTGADPQFFTLDQFDTHLSTGTTAGVTLDVPQSGTLPSGTTLIATIHPQNVGYTGLIANIGGNSYSVAVLAPEPGSLALLLFGAGGLWVLARRKLSPIEE